MTASLSNLQEVRLCVLISVFSSLRFRARQTQALRDPHERLQRGGRGSQQPAAGGVCRGSRCAKLLPLVLCPAPRHSPPRHTCSCSALISLLLDFRVSLNVANLATLLLCLASTQRPLVAFLFQKNNFLPLLSETFGDSDVKPRSISSYLLTSVAAILVPVVTDLIY